MDAHLEYSAEYSSSDEDYIDMEVPTPTNNGVRHCRSSREFEFQIFSSSSERDHTTAASPADELFYKGKLLPLHLPPQLQMVEKLLLNPKTSCKTDHTREDREEHSFSTPLFTTAATSPAAARTPFESCNVSPAGSCTVSRELHPDEYVYEYLAEASSHGGDRNAGKSWTRKLKLIKKLKASRAYVKSLFHKSGCSDKSTTAAMINVRDGSIQNADECGKKCAISTSIKTTSGQIVQKYGTRSFRSKNNGDDNRKGRHRRSFSAVSGAIKRLSSSKFPSSSVSSSGASSASSSNNSNGFQEMQFFKRSISANLEVENPIQAAIAHCKRSQQQFHSKKTSGDVGICSLSAPRILPENQERPGLCRG